MSGKCFNRKVPPVFSPAQRSTPRRLRSRRAYLSASTLYCYSCACANRTFTSASAATVSEIVSFCAASSAAISSTALARPARSVSRTVITLHFLAHGGAGFVGFGLACELGTRFFSHGDGQPCPASSMAVQRSTSACSTTCFFDVFVFDVAFGSNTFQIHCAPGCDFGFFGFTFFLRLLLGNAGFLFGAAHGDFLLLLLPSVFAFTRDFQALLFGFEIFSFNRQSGILPDFITFFAAAFRWFQ